MIVPKPQGAACRKSENGEICGTSVICMNVFIMLYALDKITYGIFWKAIKFSRPLQSYALSASVIMSVYTCGIWKFSLLGFIL